MRPFSIAGIQMYVSPIHSNIPAMKIKLDTLISTFVIIFLLCRLLMTEATALLSAGFLLFDPFLLARLVAQVDVGMLVLRDQLRIFHDGPVHRVMSDIQKERLVLVVVDEVQ